MKIIESIFEFHFIIELFVLAILFTTSFQKRKHFAWRALVIICSCLITADIFLNIEADYWMLSTPFTIIRYIILFFLVMASILFCYKVSVLTSIFCVTGIYAIQHLIYNFDQIIMIGFNIKQYVYEGNEYYIIYVILYFIIVSSLYTLIHLFFIKKFKRPDEKYFQNKFIIVLCIFVNLYATVFSVIFRITQENAQMDIFLICVLLDIMCCLFTMYILFYIFRTSVLKDELNVIQSLLNKEKTQFSISQTNMELMNIKFHDLKHQLTHLSSKIEVAEMEELKKIISLYDIPLTGNRVLDVVMTEKKLQCEQENIELTYMIDGEKLNFLKETDIYSLFGNALDNAINSVRSLKCKEKRIISLIVKESMGLVSVHIENYYQGNLDFKEGLPITTKKDTNYHGFGMKSIKFLTEKYDGELSITADDDVFSLNIIFQNPRFTV